MELFYHIIKKSRSFLDFLAYFLYIWLVCILQAPVAQSVEQIPFKDKVVGSIPTGRTKHVMFCASRRHDGAEAGSRKKSAEFYAWPQNLENARI